MPMKLKPSPKPRPSAHRETSQKGRSMCQLVSPYTLHRRAEALSEGPSLKSTLQQQRLDRIHYSTAMMAKKKRKMQTADEILLTAREAVTVLRETPSCAPTLRRVLKLLSDGGPTAESFGKFLVVNGFLQLVPSIMRQASRKGAAVGIEVLGALSLSSLATHHRVVSDKDSMCALAGIFESADVKLLTGACHAVVDLIITPFGCEALRESGVLDHLLHLLCWTADSAEGVRRSLVDEGLPSTSWTAGEPVFECIRARKPSEILSCDHIETTCAESEIVTSALEDTIFCADFDELVTTALSAMSALLRNCGIATISNDLLRNVLQVLRRYWLTVRKMDHVLLNSTASDNEPKWTCNRQRRHLIAKCVVQLSMEQDSICGNRLSVDQGLFESTYCNVEQFFEKDWEQAPVLVGRKMPSCLLALSKRFASLAAVVDNFLAWSVTCPTAFADQVDSLNLFEGIESNLGEPMIYGQDIRIVKTVVSMPDSHRQGLEATIEMPYNPNGVPSDGHGARHVHPREILEAVERGYTVAIKGMELRCSEIADTADSLARQCGQPSVGVNLYLTPPNAQGLDLHFDDHCVFVCQLVGRKTWNIFPPQKVLPRLYSSLTLNCEALNGLPSTIFNLEEGDILYIPRGFPHKARSGQSKERSGACLAGSWDLRTDATNLRPTFCSTSREQENGVDDILELGDATVEENPGSFKSGTGKHSCALKNSLSASFSLHLTFGVEVEPPFEWEGLVHIALRLWAEERWQTLAKHRQSGLDSTKECHERCEQLCEGLLHIAIKILGEKETVFRKACMIAAETVRPPYSGLGVGQAILASPKTIPSTLVCGSQESLICTFCDSVSVEYFQTLVGLVAQKANCKEAYSFSRSASDEDLQTYTGGMEWLRHVQHSGRQSTAGSVLSMVQFNEVKEFSLSEVEFTFGTMKAEFGQALMFHQASNALRSVWSQYRIIRKKFMTGMLALHDTCDRV